MVLGSLSPTIAGAGRSTVRTPLAQSTITELVRRAESAGLIDREQSQRDARVAHLRLTPDGDRRLMLAFTELETERMQLRDAFSHLDGGLTGSG